MTDNTADAPFDFDLHLAKLIERACDLLPCASGGIILLDPLTQALEPFAYYNLPPEQEIFSSEVGLVGATVQSQRPQLENDLPVALRHYPTARSAMAVPIMLEEQFLGVFIVESEHLNAYTPRDLSLLETLAEQVSLAYDLTDMHALYSESLDTLARSNEQLALRNEFSRMASSDDPLEVLLPRMAEYLTRIGRADAAAITLWDALQRRPERLAAYGLPAQDFLSRRNRPDGVPSLTETIIKTGQPVILNETQNLEQPPTPFIAEFGARAVLAMPMISRGAVIGVFFLLQLRENREPFTQDHVEQMGFMLDQIALTIDNRMLLQDIQTRLSEAQVLLKIAEITSNNLQVDDILNQTLALSRDTFEIGFGVFMLYNRHDNVLVITADKHFGLPEGVSGMRFAVNAPGSQLAIVFNSGTPYFNNTLSLNLPPSFKPYHALIEILKLRNILIVPLRVQDEPTGVLVIGNKRGDFSRADAALLMAMGSHVAAALRNRDLLEDTRERLRETEALQRVAEITGSTLDLDEMLERAVREAAQLMGAEGAIMMLPDLEKGVLRPHARSRYGSANLIPFVPLPLDGDSRMVQVFLSGKPNLQGEMWFGSEDKAFGLTIFPLNRRSSTLGVIGLINHSRGMFDDAHMDMMRAIAAQIATSMENARLFAAERKRADMTALVNQIGREITAALSLKELSRKLVRAVQTRFAYETVHLILIDENTRQAVVQGSVSALPDYVIKEGTAFTPSAGVIGQVLSSNEQRLISDLSKSLIPPENGFAQPAQGSLLTLPLRYGTRTLGALQVVTLRVNGFDPLDIQVLETLAAQASVTIENARLWDQVRRRLLEQSIVHQIGQDLTSIIKYQELVSAIVKHMNRALDTAVCLLIMHTPEDSLRLDAAYVLPAIDLPPELPQVGETLADSWGTIVHQSIESRRYQVITHPANPEADSTPTEFTVLSTPMILGERVIGALVWIESRESRTFSDEDIRLAGTLATQASIALVNALLVEELERRAVELTKANKLKSEFLASISHELRTPMNSINGYSEMLMRGLYGALTEKQNDRLERILRNGRNLLALIDDLLDLSKIDAGKMELQYQPTSLKDEVAAIIYNLESQAASKGLYLTLEAPDDLPLVHADQVRLRQVITNLLSNALKFTKTGGVAVRIHRAERDTIEYLWTSVTDTGVGIRKEDQSIIFDEFRQADGSTTREFGGTGLGLAITKRLVEMMGGAIWVESELGTGSTFTFSIRSVV